MIYLYLNYLSDAMVFILCLICWYVVTYEVGWNDTYTVVGGGDGSMAVAADFDGG